MNKCIICNVETKNQKYCNPKCQHEGLRKTGLLGKIKKNCLLCNKEFYTKKSNILVYDRGKYCSRNCKDIHQKILYTGKNNPSFGRIISIEERTLRSKMQIEIWKKPSHKEKVKLGIRKFIIEHGYYPGTDIISRDKKKITCIKKYGEDSNLKVKELHKAADDACFEKYAKHSWQIATDKLRGRNGPTKIETKMSDILAKNNIQYQTQFKILYDIQNFKYKQYDFYIKDKNLLIEVDGDYWHANPKFFDIKKLSKIQENTIKNDNMKNILAEQSGFLLLRFWECDITDNNFEKSFLELYEKI